MKWELHAHTSEGSLCGHISAAEVVARHLEAGFDGIVITDHFSEENVQRRPGTPEEQVLSWLGGYRQARKAGERLGLTVLFGTEVRLIGSGNEYLLYGAEPEFLLEHPAVNQLSLPDFRNLAARHHILMIQAHPNRLSYCRPVAPAYVDGYEVFNGNPRHDSHNGLSASLAKETPSLIHTSGSDYHQIEDIDTGSMEIAEPVHTSAQLADCLRRKAFVRTFDFS